MALEIRWSKRADKKFDKIIENKKKAIRGFTIVKQISIFYHIDNHQIIILDFFDNRQSPKKKRF